MNFDKFKQIDMPDVDVQPDPTYIKKLNSLPQKRKSVAPVISTVCAAVVALVVFGLWVLVGNGIRADRVDKYLAEGALSATAQELDLGDVITPFQFGLEYYSVLPLFNAENPPSFVELLLMESVLFESDGCTQQALDATAAMFGTTAVLPDDRAHFAPASRETDNKYTYGVEIPIFVSALCYDMEDGQYKNYVVTYEYRKEQYMISYVAKKIHDRPIQYIANVPVDRELKKEYYDDKIYNAVRKAVFSDDNIKFAEFYIYNYDKVSDDLYCCSVGINSIAYKDENNIKPLLKSEVTYGGTLRALFIENKDGEFIVSDNQERDVPIELYYGYSSTPSGKDAEYYKGVIKDLGITALDEFEDDKRIPIEDAVPAYDDDFTVSFVNTYTARYGQFVYEVGYIKDGREYIFGYIFEKCILYKRENKLYTDMTVKIDPASTPFMYDAKKELPNAAYLPQSMGIEIPNLNDKLVLPTDAVPIVDSEEYAYMVEELTAPDHYHSGVEYSRYTVEELRAMGYTQYDYIAQTEYYDSNFTPVDKSRLFNRFPLRAEGIGMIHDNWGLYLFEMKCIGELGFGYYVDTFTQQLLVLKDYGISPYDVSYLLEKYKTPEKVVNQSKNELKNALTEYYTQKYEAIK